MATYWLYTCTGTRGEATTITGSEYGTCSPASAGAWVEVDTLPLLSEPDFEVVAWACAATTLMWVIGLAVGLIVGVLRKAR